MWGVWRGRTGEATLKKMVDTYLLHQEHAGPTTKPTAADHPNAMGGIYERVGLLEQGPGRGRASPPR